MKVLHIIDSGGMYGAEIMLLNLMREQVKMGLEPILASIGEHSMPEKMLEVEAVNSGLRVRSFRFMRGPNLAGALAILHYARQERVDLLHSHGYKGNIFFGLLLRCVRRVPLVSTVHGWTWTRGISRMMLYEHLDSYALLGADKVIPVSEQMLHHQRLWCVSTNKMTVIENGITERNENGENGLDERIIDFCRQGITVGAIGRLSAEKGFALLMEAFATLFTQGMDIRLVILGEGGERASLEAKARQLGIEDRVLMPGYCQNARSYLLSFSLFVMSSFTEGLPMVLLEAMQVGVPILATRVGGIPTVLQEGECGLLINVGSREALEYGIREIIDNRQEAAKRATNAKRRQSECYTSRNMAEQYLKIYQSVLQ